MRNRDVAELLEGIATLLDLKGESRFRVGAYREAARRIEGWPADIAELQQQGRLEEIPGVGPSIAAKIEEYLQTGRVRYWEDLRQDIDPAVADLLQVAGVGPRRAQMLYRTLGITSVADLGLAAREHRLAGTPGFQDRMEQKILREVDRLQQRSRRLLLGVALPAAEELVGLLRGHPAVLRIDPAGSIRRRNETIGDIDILVASEQPLAVMEAVVSLPIVREVLAQGPTRTSVLTRDHLQVDVRVMRVEEYGSALQYFTGSKSHNIALRDLAIRRGLKLSEYGIFDERSGQRLGGTTEEEIYDLLDLAWMPPELRENRGELEAAARGKLPHLLEEGDLQGEFHLHSRWSDGADSIDRIVAAARARGYQYIAITDHSQGLGIARGLSMERIRQQRQEIDELNRRHAPFRVLQGIELEIRSDGSLDYPDEVLREFDLVTASVHSGFGQPREKMTQRIIRAVRHPYVDILNHPSGRLIGRRSGYEVDLEAVIRAAAESGTALEINGQPERLDLSDTWARQARETGVMLAIDSDAHSANQMGYVRYGVAMARRAWVEPQNVLNCLSLRQLRQRLRRARRAA